MTEPTPFVRNDHVEGTLRGWLTQPTNFNDVVVTIPWMEYLFAALDAARAEAEALRAMQDELQRLLTYWRERYQAEDMDALRTRCADLERQVAERPRDHWQGEYERERQRLEQAKREWRAIYSHKEEHLAALRAVVDAVRDAATLPELNEELDCPSCGVCVTWRDDLQAGDRAVCDECLTIRMGRIIEIVDAAAQAAHPATEEK